jgi:hypothetical protein
LVVSSFIQAFAKTSSVEYTQSLWTDELLRRLGSSESSNGLPKQLQAEALQRLRQSDCDRESPLLSGEYLVNAGGFQLDQFID